MLVDLKEGRIIPDVEAKQAIVEEKPYGKWVKDHLIHLDDVLETADVFDTEFERIHERQLVYGYTYEELTKMLMPLIKDENDPVGSMGYDSPLAVLSKKPQLLYNYFKQQFAQVTNPPIDAIREKAVTAVGTTIGAERNLLEPEPLSCRHIYLPSPILNNEELAKLRSNKMDGFKAETLDMVFEAQKGGQGLEAALDTLFANADQAISNGATLLILSDRNISAEKAPIPALLAVSSLHHHLIRSGTRTEVSLLVESAEPREVHHHALLIGYGAEAINPYFVFDTIDDWIQKQLLTDFHYVEACRRYVNGTTNGIMKVLSKMGISTIQSYRGAQIFEAIGIDPELIDRHFTWTASRIGASASRQLRTKFLPAMNVLIHLVKAMMVSLNQEMICNGAVMGKSINTTPIRFICSSMRAARTITSFTNNIRRRSMSKQKSRQRCVVSSGSKKATPFR